MFDSHYKNPRRNIHFTVGQIRATIRKMKALSTRRGDKYTTTGVNWKIAVSNPTKAVRSYILNRGDKGDVRISYDRPNNTISITPSPKEMK